MNKEYQNDITGSGIADAVFENSCLKIILKEDARCNAHSFNQNASSLLKVSLRTKPDRILLIKLKGIEQ